MAARHHPDNSALIPSTLKLLLALVACVLRKALIEPFLPKLNKMVEEDSTANFELIVNPFFTLNLPYLGYSFNNRQYNFIYYL